MIVKEEYREIQYTLVFSEEELKQIYRLMKNEIEGAEVAEATTHNMYCIIKSVLNRRAGLK